MKKKFLPIFAAAALVALGSATALASCGTDPASSSKTPESSVTPVSSETPKPSSETPKPSSESKTSSESMPEVIHVTTVNVTLAKTEINVGETTTVSVEVLPENATDKTFTLSSSNANVATIEGTTITAVGKGITTIKAVSTDGAIEGTATLTVNVVMTDPTLVNEGEATYTVAAGEDLLLPKVKATSGDGETDISDKIEVEDYNDSDSLNADGTTFNSKIAGVHTLSYYVEEGTGDDLKYDELEITITVTPATAETELDETTYDPAAVGTYGTFADNFKEGKESKLYKSLGGGNDGYSLSATSDAIAGNSLLIDFNKTAGSAANAVFVNTFSDSFLRGKPVTYEVSFDYKPIVGTQFQCYFGINYDGANGTNAQFVSDKTIGKTSHYSISFSEFTFPTSGNAWFQFFNLSAESGDCIVAIDNFKVTAKKCAETTSVVPTAEELQAEGGYTFNWKDKGGTFGGKGQTEVVENIENETIKAALKNREGFGENVMHLTGSDGHVFSGLDATNLIGGKKLKISFLYYCVNENNFNMIVMTASGSNPTMNDGLSRTVVDGNIKSFVYEITIPAGATGINFYPQGNNSFSIYMGDMKVELTEADPIPEDETALGNKVGDKWTVTSRSFGSEKKGWGGSVTNKVATPEAAKGNEGIGDTMAKIQWTEEANKTLEWYSSAGKQVEIGHQYKFTLIYYVESWTEGRRMLINIDNGKFLPADSDETPDNTLPMTVGYHKYEFTWTSTTSMNFFSFYLPGDATGAATDVLYVASTTIELIKINK